VSHQFDWTAGVVAIFGPGSNPVGSGFLEAKNLNATCAHVLNDAGWPFESWDKPVKVSGVVQCSRLSGVYASMMAFNFSKSAASWRLKRPFMMRKRTLMRTLRFTPMWSVMRLPSSSGASR
jgi:hypothetical protein